MPLVPLRPVLDATVKYGYAQGAFNVNAVAQAEAVIDLIEAETPAAARQAAGEFGVPKNQLYDLALRTPPSP